jgi:lipoyl-dependent peroxiredoxin
VPKQHGEATWSTGVALSAPQVVSLARSHERAETRESGTSPEELIAAAHAGCFAMALSSGLDKAGHPPERLETSANVSFQAGEGITGIHLTVRGTVPGIDASGFSDAAEEAKANCPVSKALAGVPMTLEASLV